MATWELEDVEAAARANPRSFFIPSRDERVSQSIGDEVRLHFLLTQEGADLPRAAVRWMYRETPDRPDDSGWRLLAGGESESYLDDPTNSRLCNVGWLTDFDPSLLPAIRADVGAAFERATMDAPWVAVQDSAPPEE